MNIILCTESSNEVFSIIAKKRTLETKNIFRKASLASSSRPSPGEFGSVQTALVDPPARGTPSPADGESSTSSAANIIRTNLPTDLHRGPSYSFFCAKDEEWNCSRICPESVYNTVSK
ncbi:hypothetical protein Y032_0347g3163 [Ancylostoma ceylanicum]|uniref:Uncharacterized protein n=1 Tax=Ancylostoma ceylanicum TaxID=53326 RepID=A0A016RY73_9BILA|nr:hypothetical protein Y032_0347g3163 [Ancylostoma ceylanicum]